MNNIASFIISILGFVVMNAFIILVALIAARKLSAPQRRGSGQRVSKELPVYKAVMPSSSIEAPMYEAPTYESNSGQQLYRRKPLLGYKEKELLAKLQNIVEGRYIIFPQVNLAAIIEKNSDDRYQNELFRNVDFGIFDTSYNVIALVELNDSTHFSKKRRYRDYKVQNICEEVAGIPLIKLWADKPNEEWYIKMLLNEKGIVIF